MMKCNALLAITLLFFLGLGSGDVYGQRCSVDTLTANFLSCNDNGTSQPGDDYYIADFTTTFTGQPTTGDLELLVKGLTFSTSVTGLANQFQFLSIQLPADGLPVQATMRFTAVPGCELTQTVGTAPAACSPSCSMTGLTADFSACNDNGTPQPTDDYSNTDFTMTFSNPPTIGNLELVVDGQTYMTPAAGLGTQFQFLSIPLPADGMPVAATARFSALPACTLSANVGSTPPACSIPLVDPAPIPTITQWTALVLILILMAGGLMVLRWKYR